MKNMALRARVSLFTVSIFLAALWALAWHQASNQREEFQKLLLAQQYSKVRYIANNLDEAMKARQFALATVARAITPDLLRRPRQLQAFLEAQRALGRTFSLGMYVVSATGLGLADFPVMAGRSGADYTQRDYFLETMATGQPAIGRPRLGSFAKEPILLMAVPVLDPANRTVAVLVGANQIHGSDLFKEVQSLHSSPDGELNIISPKDRLFIASTDARRILQPIAAPGVNQLLDRYLQGYEGSGLMQDSRRIEGLSSGSRISTSGWVVEAFLPTDLAFAPLRARQREIYRDAALVSLALALVMGLFLRQQFTPLRDTSALLHDMAGGRLTHEQVPVQGAPEIRQLLESFNLLQAHLVEKDEARTRAEASLRDAHQFNDQIIRGALEGIIVYDRELRYRVWNPFMEQLTGLPASAVLGKHPLELFPFLQDAGGQEARSRALAGEASESVDFHFQVNGTGKSGWANETISPLLDAKGEVSGVIVMVRDLTARKLAELSRQESESRFLHSQKMESLGSLAGGVAHDMNNVLGAILGLASAHIGKQPYGSPLHQALDTICKATERGGKMVKSLLSFARQSPAEQRQLDLNAILRDQASLLERTTLATVHLQLDLEAGLRPILGDASALTHAFMNLCVNAVDAMPQNGTLTLRTRNVDTDWIEVVVEDTGTGMPKEVLEKALDPFFTTKEVGRGTGLGLSMVYSTVKAHRGQLEIQSEPGHGTRVMMRFPACAVEAQALEPSDSTEVSVPLKALEVLLVDDDELIQVSTQMILATMGHSVNTAQSGEEALAKLEAGFEPDLVILDMNMPGLGGTGTLPRLRVLRPAVPVLLATGRTDQTALTLASSHAGVTLFPKPFGLRELQKYLETLGLG